MFLPSGDYNFIYSRVPRVCVSVVLCSHRGVALVKRVEPPKVGLWHLPGGRINKGESIAQTASRVLQRELGVTAFTIVSPCIGVIEHLSESYADVDIHNVDVVLHAKSEGRDFIVGAGEGEASWFEAPPKSNWWSYKYISFLVERGFL